MPVLTFSAELDTNVPIVEEFPDGLKATAYFEDYLFKLFQDIENINVVAGLAFGIINGDSGQANAAVATDTLDILGGTSISTVAADGAPDSLVITNDDPFPEAPIDGQPYGRRDAGWIDLDTLFIGDAPIDGSTYARLNGSWVDIDAGLNQDHGLLTGLADDDHLQYLLLAGRAGGQSAFGGTAAADDLDLAANTVGTGAGRINANSPIVFGAYSATTAAYGFSYTATESFTSVFVGGGLNFSGTIGFSNSTFIYESFRGSPAITTGVNPGFAAYTVLQSLPALLSGSGAGHNPLAPLVLNAGPVCSNGFSGSRTTSTMAIINGAMQVRATVSGAVMNITNYTGLQFGPKYSTVAGSTINFGSIRGLWIQNPAVALFQPGAGTETMARYIGVEIDNITFGGTLEKIGIRSAMTAGTNKYFIRSTGNALSQFAGNIRFLDNLGNQYGTSADYIINYDSTEDALEFIPFIIGGNALYLEAKASDEWEYHAGAGLDIGMQWNVNAISFGTTAPTPNSNNWFTIFSGANLRAVQLAGEYSDVLWTAGGSIDVAGFAVSDLQAFKINSVSTLLNGGTVADSATLYVAAMQSFGATRVQALRVLGRSRLDGHLNQGSQSPAQLTANTNDWQLAANNGQRGVVLLTTDGLGPYNVTGIDASFGFAQTADFITIINISADTITFTNQDVLSLAANRFITSTGAGIAVAPNESIRFWYDDTGVLRWRHIDEQP